MIDGEIKVIHLNPDTSHYLGTLFALVCQCMIILIASKRRKKVFHDTSCRERKQKIKVHFFGRFRKIGAMTLSDFWMTLRKISEENQGGVAALDDAEKKPRRNLKWNSRLLMTLTNISTKKIHVMEPPMT